MRNIPLTRDEALIVLSAINNEIAVAMALSSGESTDDWLKTMPVVHREDHDNWTLVLSDESDWDIKSLIAQADEYLDDTISILNKL